MTFGGWTIAQLWPLMLGGTVAITALYLLRMRRRRVVVPFAALWEQVTRESESRRLWRRLRRLLSWLVQVLILALVCLSLGDPKPEVWLRDPVTLAVVIDRSASMSAPSEADPTRDRLTLAKELAEGYVNALGPTDQAVVIAAGEEVMVASPMGSDPAVLVPGIEAIETTYGEADLTRALALASHAVGEQEGAQIVVITDGALSVAGAAALTDCVEGPVACSVARVTGPVDNVAITAFAARRYPYARDKIEVLAEVENLGDEAISVELDVQADGVAVGTRELTLPAGASERVSLPDLDAARSRFVARLSHAAGATTNDDGSPRAVGLGQDDEAFAVVPPLSPLEVVLVTDGGNLFLEAALLTLDDHVNLAGISPAAARAGAKEIEDADVVFFDTGPEKLPETLPDKHIVAFDPWRHEDSPFSIAKRADKARPFLTEQNRKHPLLDHVVLKDVNIARGTTFETEPGDEVLVSSLGEPIAVLREKALSTIAFGFDPRQSDLPMRTAFPVLVDNIVRYLEQREAGFVASIGVGQGRELVLAKLGLPPEAVTRVKITAPDGTTHEAPVERGRFRLRALQPGFYGIESMDGPLAGTSVELAVNQASVQASDLHDRIEALELPVAADAEEPASPDPIGQGPLWTLLILAAAGIVALEWATYHRRVTV